MRRTKAEIAADTELTMRIRALEAFVADPASPPLEIERAHRRLSNLRGRLNARQVRRAEQREAEKQKREAARRNSAPRTVEDWIAQWPVNIRALIGPGPTGEWLEDELAEIAKNEEYERRAQEAIRKCTEDWRKSHD